MDVYPIVDTYTVRLDDEDPTELDAMIARLVVLDKCARQDYFETAAYDPCPGRACYGEGTVCYLHDLDFGDSRLMLCTDHMPVGADPASFVLTTKGECFVCE